MSIPDTLYPRKLDEKPCRSNKRMRCTSVRMDEWPNTQRLDTRWKCEQPSLSVYFLIFATLHFLNFFSVEWANWDRYRILIGIFIVFSQTNSLTVALILKKSLFNRGWIPISNCTSVFVANICQFILPQVKACDELSKLTNDLKEFLILHDFNFLTEAISKAEVSVFIFQSIPNSFENHPE